MSKATQDKVGVIIGKDYPHPIPLKKYGTLYSENILKLNRFEKESNSKKPEPAKKKEFVKGDGKKNNYKGNN